MNIENIQRQCTQAGLPVTKIWMDEFGILQASFERGLTPEEWQTFCDIREGATYADKRRREYPPLIEFADAYYWLQKGNTALMTEYIAKCDAVKNRYPKP